MTNFASILIGATIYLSNEVISFSVIHVTRSRASTNLYLEDHIAEMIDREYYHLTHKEEFEQQTQVKNKKVLEVVLPQSYEFSEDDLQYMAEIRKDKVLASKDPQRYCAERCVSTGHCEVYEDLFDFSAEQVMEFCTDCVLSEEEEACDVPDKFLDDDLQILKP